MWFIFKIKKTSASSAKFLNYKVLYLCIFAYDIPLSAITQFYFVYPLRVYCVSPGVCIPLLRTTVLDNSDLLQCIILFNLSILISVPFSEELVDDPLEVADNCPNTLEQNLEGRFIPEFPG